MMKLFENIPKIKNIRLIINSTQNYGRNCFLKTACLIQNFSVSIIFSFSVQTKKQLSCELSFEGFH